MIFQKVIEQKFSQLSVEIYVRLQISWWKSNSFSFLTKQVKKNENDTKAGKSRIIKKKKITTMAPSWSSQEEIHQRRTGIRQTQNGK